MLRIPKFGIGKNGQDAKIPEFGIPG